jgi:DNA-binding NarL/FixJ family response regulator
MAIRRVFAIWAHPIFHESVRLLLNRPDIEWAGATSDYAAAKDAILSLRPDTVLVEEVGGQVPAEVKEVLEAIPWSVRIISLNLVDNKSMVYQRERRTIEQPEDLIRLIHGD